MHILTDKIVLITGGTGSFGETAILRMLASEISEIRVFSRDEKKQEEMRNSLQNERIKCYIGDVRDKDSLSIAMQGVDYVFHAAALKQVPSCEFYPIEALKTNVIGTNNVVEAAISCGVGKVVVLSTDKAVYPINSMGITKALAEKLVAARSRSVPLGGTVLTCTRYGNVMASRGSVIPLFVDQVKRGVPLTITDPNMTRFLMSLEDSVDLVLYAFEHGQQGDLFVQKAPACTVYDLASVIHDIFDGDGEIRMIGTRHGEKLYESLVSREEMVKAEDMGNYYRIPCDTRDLNYNKYFVDGASEIDFSEDYTSHNTKRLGKAGVRKLLLSLPYIQGELDV